MKTAKDLMNLDLPVLSLQDDPVNALNLMDQYHIGHVPVVDQGKFLGVLTETDLLSAGTVISEFIETEGELIPVSVKPDNHIFEVLKVAGENHLTIIPVVDEQSKFVGSITLEELVNQLSHMQGVSKPGGIAVIEMSEKDYSLQQIARIVEENDAKILSLSVSQGDEGQMELNLKINKPDLNAILQSFERFGYHVKVSYQEPMYTEDLQKRYEELMRYLNI